MKKYSIITYGCQMNLSDSERIASLLEKQGCKQASSQSEADLIVVNMCSVRQSAVNRVYAFKTKFKTLKKKNKNLKTILTGCISKKDHRKFTEIFDLVLSIKDLPQWPRHFETGTDSSLWPPTLKRNTKYLDMEPKSATRFSALVPISSGCNNSCAYCIVPFARGPLACRSHKRILRDVRKHIQKGAKEIWLLGQNVNDYKSPADPKIDFAKLLELADSVKGDFWIRFTSPNPKDFSDKTINAMARCGKVTQYLNLPVQSGDNEILKKMNRAYTIQEYKALVKKIRSNIPEVALSTDVIVGFPGETKKQFNNTLKLFKDVKFDMAYIARYSARPNTKALEMKDSVSKTEKQKRWKKLTEVLKKTAFENNEKYVGKELEVLIEDCSKGFLLGKTRTYKKVGIKSKDEKLTGKIIKVKITKALTWGLKGEKI